MALALIGLGAWLRLHGLLGHGLWIDEYGTWWAVAGAGWPDVFSRALAVHGQSPFYYLLVRASVDLLGAGPLALRLPSVLCGVGLLLVSLPLAVAAFGSRRAALGALAAFAVNERLIFYSQEARPYALALLCAALSFLFYLRLLREPGALRPRVGYVLAAAATFYAHYLFGVVLVVQAAYLCFRRSLLVPQLRAWLGTALLLGLALLPGLIQLTSIYRRRHILDWLEPTGWREGAEIALALVDLPIFLAAAAAAAVASVGWGIQRLQPGSRPGLVLLWMLVPFCIIAVVPPLLGVDLLHRRHVVITVPAVCLLTGWLLALPARRSPIFWLPFVVFLLAVAGLRLQPREEQLGVFSERYTSERWGRALSELRKVHRPGEPILYATQLVELDDVVRGTAPPAVVEFTTWPVAAYLPPESRASLVALPFRETEESRRLVHLRLKAAARHRRVWIIGLPPIAKRAAQMARSRPDLRQVRHEHFGRLHLFLFEGRGS